MSSDKYTSALLALQQAALAFASLPESERDVRFVPRFGLHGTSALDRLCLAACTFVRAADATMDEGG